MVFWHERTLAMPELAALFSTLWAAVYPCRWSDDGACHRLFWRANNLVVFQPPAVCRA